MPQYRIPLKPAIAIISSIILLTATAAIADSIYLAGAKVSTNAVKNKIVPLETDLVFSAGYRVDDLDWNIAGDINGKNPDILSELTWDDVESCQIKLSGGWLWPNIFAVRVYADYGWIFDGKNQDSDYSGNNRTLEWSRSNNNADDGNVLDVSGAIGYPFRWGEKVIGTLTPLAGYSYHQQNLKIKDGYQTVSAPQNAPAGISPAPLGPISGLDSKYDTEWNGPWIGLDLRFKVPQITTFAQRFETYASFEYHWATYHAEADWNLAERFAHPKSFEHNADGNGWKIDAGLNFRIHHNWALNFNYEYQDWSTDSGTDKVFYSDGSTAKTRLNEVNWTSYSLSLGVSLRF